MNGVLLGICAAAVIALLSGLGVGSGGLLVIWLTMIEGIDADTARGLNLLFFVFSAGAAFMIHIIKKRINVRFALYLALFACIGTLAGTYIGSMINSTWLRRIFGAMFVLTGIFTLYGTSKELFGIKKVPKSSKSAKFFSKNPLQNKKDMI